MTLSKIQQAAIAVQNGMQPEVAAKKYGVDLKELNRKIAEELNGGKPGEIGDIVKFSTKKDGSVKKTEEKNSDGTTTVTKYYDDGTVKKSRVKLSFKDKVKNGWKGVKNFGKELVCNKDGKVSVGKVAGLVGTAAVLTLAAPVAGVLGASAAVVSGIATACGVAGTVMAGALVVNGVVNVTKGEIHYQKAQDKASAEAAYQEIGEGTASIGMAALPKALSKIGKKLIKPFEGLFKGKAKQDLSVKPNDSYAKPNEKLVYEYTEDGEIVGSYDPIWGTKTSEVTLADGSKTTIVQSNSNNTLRIEGNEVVAKYSDSNGNLVEKTYDINDKSFGLPLKTRTYNADGYVETYGYPSPVKVTVNTKKGTTVMEVLNKKTTIYDKPLEDGTKKIVERREMSAHSGGRSGDEEFRFYKTNYDENGTAISNDLVKIVSAYDTQDLYLLDEYGTGYIPEPEIIKSQTYVPATEDLGKIWRSHKMVAPPSTELKPYSEYMKLPGVKPE